MTKKQNEEYNNLIKDIINNEEFIKTQNDKHHGSTKYNHLLNVSKCSFIMGKIFHANIETVTVSGVLHDFFHGERTESIENSYLNHPLTAVINAKEVFNINKEEENAIRTHMFHYESLKKALPFINKEDRVTNLNKPQSKEAWIVCISDFLVSAMECYRYKIPYALNIFVIGLFSKFLS